MGVVTIAFLCMFMGYMKWLANCSIKDGSLKVKLLYLKHAISMYASILRQLLVTCNGMQYSLL